MLKMTLRWYSNGMDSVTLQQIRQIPGMTGVVTSMMDIPVGEVWPIERLQSLKKEVNDNGLDLEVIESVNIHEDIKLGLPSRDKFIQDYITTIENLSKVGVKVLCYNFMPVLDWARSELNKVLEDGSKALSYDHDFVMNITPDKLVNSFTKAANGFEMPGWEPERLKAMQKTLKQYEEITEEKYWENIEYFIKAVVPYAEKYDVKLAIHPDDPPWPIFGLPRLITSRDNIRRFLDIYDSPYNGITLCTGSLGANRDNDIPALIREFAGKGKIPFTHVRNIKFHDGKSFDESAHVSECGSLDLYEIMKAFYDTKTEGYIRPDHGRLIWGEVARPGYGLYDRALGATYLIGLMEAIEKNNR